MCSIIINENETGYTNRGNSYRKREKKVSTVYINVILGIWGDIQSKQPYRVYNLHDSSRGRCKRQPPDIHQIWRQCLYTRRRDGHSHFYPGRFDGWRSWSGTIQRKRKSKTMVNLSQMLLRNKNPDANCFKICIYPLINTVCSHLTDVKM